MEKDYKKTKDEMSYNIRLEKLLTKIISGALKKYFPDTKLEAHFTEFKTGTGVLKTTFSGADRQSEAYLKGFPQNGAFKPNGIRITYNDNGFKGIVELKNMNGKFKPVKSEQFERFLNCGIEINKEDVVKKINEAIHKYNLEAVHDKYGTEQRFESRTKKNGLYIEDLKLI